MCKVHLSWFASAVALALAAGAGCSDGAPANPDALSCTPVAAGQSRMLVDHDLWRLATPEEDPWAEFRPADITCPDRSRQPEDFAGVYAYGVLTDGCQYTTVVQETTADACAGETFYVWIWNFALTGPEGASAHLGVKVGDVLWQAERAIPSTAALATDRIVLAHDIPKGTPIYYHVRNHGSNSYELIELSIVNPDPDGAPAQ
ncbi:MAG: hypothetical protein U1F43_25260 [Myxococcota bacterium]